MCALDASCPSRRKKNSLLGRSPAALELVLPGYTAFLPPGCSPLLGCALRGTSLSLAATLEMGSGGHRFVGLHSNWSASHWCRFGVRGDHAGSSWTELLGSGRSWGARSGMHL